MRAAKQGAASDALPAQEGPAPEPVGAPAPEPRTVWASPDGRTALVARDWADGHPPSYGVLARAAAAEGAPWHAASGAETWQLLLALARWLDASPAGHRPAEH